MTETLEIVGHLNRFGHDVTPIATDAIFRRGGTLFAFRPQGEVPLSGEEIQSYEAEDFVHWLAPIKVASTSGRLLLHENLDGVQGRSQQSLTYSFLSSEEESTLRTELAVAYLAQANRALQSIENPEEQDAFMPFCSILERIARARPDSASPRLLKAMIADEFEDETARETELTEIAFEWSRLNAQTWSVDLATASPDADKGRGWETVEVFEDKLAAIGTHFVTKQSTRHETTARVDPLAIRIIENISEWAAEDKAVGSLIRSFLDPLMTVALLDLITHHQSFVSDLEGGRAWRVFATTLSLKSPKVFRASAGQRTHTFSLWGGPAIAAEAGAIQRGILIGRLRGLHARSFLTENQLEAFAGTWGKQLATSGEAAASPATTIMASSALLEILPRRKLAPEKRLSFEGLNRNKLMQAFVDLRRYDLALAEATALAKLLDISQLLTSWDEDRSAHNTSKYAEARNALETFAIAHNRLGLAAFRRNELDSSEEHFVLAHRALRALEPSVQKNRRFLDRFAFAKYMLSLLRADPKLAKEACLHYKALSLLGQFTLWQNNCVTVATSLALGTTTSSPMAIVREALRIARSEVTVTREDLLKGIRIALRANSSTSETAAPRGELSGLESEPDSRSESSTSRERLTDLFAPLITALEERIEYPLESRSVLLRGATQLLRHLAGDLTPEMFGSREYSQCAEQARALAHTMVVFLGRGLHRYLDKLFAYEALAGFFFKMRMFDDAKTANEKYLIHKPDDRIATMRSALLDGALAPELSAAMDAGQRLELRASDAAENGDHLEASRLWFAAGEICSLTALRFTDTGGVQPRKAAIRCYRAATIATPPPPHPAAVFRLGQSLYYDGAVADALGALGDIDQQDVRAAILFSRIVHTEASATQFGPQAVSRVARALAALVTQPRVSKRSLDALVDVACSLRSKAGTDSAWVGVLASSASRDDVFGFALDRLARRKYFPTELIERAKENLGAPRRDRLKLLRYYLAAISSGDAKSNVPRVLDFSVDHEDLLTLALASCRAVHGRLEHAVELISNAAAGRSNGMIKTLHAAKDALIYWRAPEILEIARDADPKLVRTSTLIEENEAHADRCIWIDPTRLKRMLSVLNQAGHYAELDNGVELSGELPRENAPVLEWAAPSVGAIFNPFTLKLATTYAVPL